MLTRRRVLALLGALPAAAALPLNELVGALPSARSSTDWFRVTPTKDGAEIYIHGLIDGGVGSFRDQLQALGSANIQLHLNSPGGVLSEVFAVFNALEAHPARIISRIDGVAAAGAGLVAMAGDEVLIAEDGWLMLQSPWMVVAGEADQLRESVDLLDRLRRLSADIYRRHSHLPEQELLRLMDQETWFDAAAAIKAGFATGVLPRRNSWPLHVDGVDDYIEIDWS